MHLTFLGTGSAMPTGERAQTGLLLTADEAAPLLVDCGSGVLSALANTDVGYEGVPTVLLTHHHLDHVSDLMALFKARWLSGATDLELVGPSGTAALVEGLLDVHDYMQGRLDLVVREVEPGAFSVAGYDVEAVETVHSMPCLAYRFEADGATLTVSGDTEATDDVAALADGSDVLVHDCSFPDEVDVDNHPTPSQLGRTLSGRQYGRVFLTHLYPHTEGRHGAMLDSLREHYTGDVTFARDGLSVEV
ncbi:MBL fold metallo-hydrolase [Halomarina ordinaria]|uniref:MBL fold metallo-hydrolase n=1 Tax=Halomarina ordinaria TaxID=3033939 RepID=A0ABD5U4G0_9EURY|nr:MBL fold metallo-hydrolase [Halomarina sp. PSRA2]